MDKLEKIFWFTLTGYITIAISSYGWYDYTSAAVNITIALSLAAMCTHLVAHMDRITIPSAELPAEPHDADTSQNH